MLPYLPSASNDPRWSLIEGLHCEATKTSDKHRVNLQNPGAGGTDERAHCHVDIGRAPLVAVKTFPIRGEASHLPQHLQMGLLLLSLRAGRHRPKSSSGVEGGKAVSLSRGQGRCVQAGLAAEDGGGHGRRQADTALRCGETGGETDKPLLLRPEN